MNIRLLGTGAADGIPGFYTDDPVSRFAREHGGRDIRTRSAAIVDGNLKIDLGPDTVSQVHANHLDPRDWSALLFTHSHEDHLCVSELQYLLFPFNGMDHVGFPIYGNPTVCGLIRDRYPEWPMELVETHSFKPYRPGAYEVVPIRAKHIEEEDCHNLLIRRADKAILYATDTGVWSEDSLDYLRGQRLDALVIEATEGLHKTPYPGHLDLALCIEIVAKLRAQGTLDGNSRVVTTHHSHSGGLNHAQLESHLAPHGMEPGYDGMLVEV